jgi:hypothetical protein
MCASVSVGRASVVFRSMFLSLLQSSHPGLARAPIMCSHFPHSNEHVITCLARLFLASCTVLELIHEPRNSRLSQSLSKNSAAQVAAGFPQLSILEVGAFNSTPSAYCPSSHFELLCSQLARFCAQNPDSVHRIPILCTEIQCWWSPGGLSSCSRLDSMLFAFEFQLLL